MKRTLNSLSLYDMSFMWPEYRHHTLITRAELKREREQQCEQRRLSNGHDGFNRQVFAKIVR